MFGVLCMIALGVGAGLAANKRFRTSHATIEYKDSVSGAVDGKINLPCTNVDCLYTTDLKRYGYSGGQLTEKIMVIKQRELGA